MWALPNGVLDRAHLADAAKILYVLCGLDILHGLLLHRFSIHVYRCKDGLVYSI